MASFFTTSESKFTELVLFESSRTFLEDIEDWLNYKIDSVKKLWILRIKTIFLSVYNRNFFLGYKISFVFRRINAWLIKVYWDRSLLILSSFLRCERREKKKDLKRVKELLANHKISNDLLKEILDWYYLDEYYKDKI